MYWWRSIKVQKHNSTVVIYLIISLVYFNRFFVVRSTSLRNIDFFLWWIMGWSTEKKSVRSKSRDTEYVLYISGKTSPVFFFSELLLIVYLHMNFLSVVYLQSPKKYWLHFGKGQMAVWISGEYKNDNSTFIVYRSIALDDLHGNVWPVHISKTVREITFKFYLLWISSISTK